ncbi:hypothetical protein [Dolosigranulum pigrum]|uniref:hypothetical protein n=1 Tax=Dolosigranulum pigrum TaxID=29394 RepID=UPI001AD8614A|nr:hypothetical protein [Dolosigranulum pigrum]QTJ42724.1 hypothetical protein FE327_01765 [Dolosigranulum pigrum]QTJ46123.1 hypothetical protein FE329_01800 [Dolosigranulum pigrum]QTJ59640.1 hypothetical protein FE337_01800 [Dolosigranulum pigrum]
MDSLRLAEIYTHSLDSFSLLNVLYTSDDLLIGISFNEEAQISAFNIIMQDAVSHINYDSTYISFYTNYVLEQCTNQTLMTYPYIDQLTDYIPSNEHSVAHWLNIAHDHQLIVTLLNIETDTLLVGKISALTSDTVMLLPFDFETFKFNTCEVIQIDDIDKISIEVSYQRLLNYTND